MVITIMQGDSWPIYMNLTQSGKTLTPDLIDDLEICVGDNWRFSYEEGTALFDEKTKRWYIWPTQNDTFSMEPGSYKPQIRAKYKNQKQVYVKGQIASDSIKVTEAKSREEL